MQYIKCTIDLKLTMSADSLNVIKWYVDSAYTVRDDFKSQSGTMVTLGRGSLVGKSNKHQLNSKSSTKVELIAASDASGEILWTQQFMEEQGYTIDNSILYQDNSSAMLLEKNGHMSCGKNTKHINARYFFIKHRENTKEIQVEYCPTGKMIADYYTKPLQGSKFTTL